jgi:hypothetical protein
MKDIMVHLLIWGAVFLFLLLLYLACDAALEGYESGGWCNLSDGSCYPGG